MPRSFPSWFRSAIGVSFLLAGGIPACAPPGTGTERDQAPPANAPGDKPAAALAPSGKSPLPLPRETWDVVYLQGARIGFIHSSYRQEERAGRPVVLIEAGTRLALSRFGQPTQQRIEVESAESLDGELIDFESQTWLGPEPMICRGRVEGKQLVIQTAAGGKTAEQRLPWQPGIGGIAAMELGLARRPMAPGEVRRQRLVMPLLNQALVAEVRLEARDYVRTPLLAGEYELLEVENRTELPGGLAMTTTLWIDRQGEILKSRMDALGQVTYRTTREVALEQLPDRPFDVGFDSVVRITPAPRDPHAARAIRYRVELEGGDPASVFINGGSQSTRLLGPHTIELSVRSRVPADLAGTAAEPEPSDADQSPNDLIQSDDPRVRDLAAEAAGDETDPWKIALRLERFVHNHIASKHFSHAFATAAEVAARPEGDCTEHAVLLAALARARGIPARVATGLVYMEAPPGFGFHMWDELYIAGHWIPLDATLARGGIGAGHIKLAHSNLKDATALGCFLPVAQVLGRLTIEVLGVE